MPNAGDVISKTAEAEFMPYRILKFGTDDAKVSTASAATDALIGVSDRPANRTGKYAVGERVDVVQGDAAYVELGGTVIRGDLLTADAQGRAVSTSTQGDRYVGIAMQSGVLGDLIDVRINLGKV